MNGNSEIREIIAFISAYDLPKKNKISDICITRMTADIDEAFLMERAEYIKAELKHNSSLQDAFQHLSHICNDKKNDCNECPVKKYCNSYIKNARKSVSKKSLKMVDLFCGAGGLSLGFTQEGFITSLANDIQECCVDTYAHNHPETPRDHIVLGDIKTVVDDIDNQDTLKDIVLDTYKGLS